MIALNVAKRKLPVLLGMVWIQQLVLLASQHLMDHSIIGAILAGALVQ